MTTEQEQAYVELVGLRDMMSRAVKFQFHVGPDPDDFVWVELRNRKEMKWAVSNGSGVYNRLGEWEYEPMPSSRTDEFFARTRYSLEEAWEIAEGLEKK